MKRPKVGIIRNLCLIGAFLMTIFNACSGFNSSKIASGPNRKGATSIYVETLLTKSETCDTSPAWVGTTVSGSLGDSLPQPSFAPLTYQWDFAHNILNTQPKAADYKPAFKPGNVSFATNGRPMIRDDHFNLQVLKDDGTWKSINLLDVARKSFAVQGIDWKPAEAGQYRNGDTSLGAIDYADPSVSAESRVVFDYNCNAYALLSASRSPLNSSVLLHSNDGGHSWAAYKIPGSEDPWGYNGSHTVVSMEVPGNSSTLLQSPALLIHALYDYAGAPHTLKLVVPNINADKSLTLAGPYTVATHTISNIRPNGGENLAISSGDLIHIAYPGDTFMLGAPRTVDPNPLPDPYIRPLAVDPSGVAAPYSRVRHGMPEYVMTVSRSTGAVVSNPVLLGVGVQQLDCDPKIDEHDQPSLAIDHQGYLHAIVAGHGGPLYYRKSLYPNDTSAWSAAEIIGHQPTADAPYMDEYSYPSLMIDPHNQPVVAARWSGVQAVHQLVTMTKSVDTGTWTEQMVVDPGRPGHLEWYSKLSIDNWGRVFLYYEFLPDVLFADEVSIINSQFGKNFSEPWLTNASGAVIPCTPGDHPYGQQCDFNHAESLNHVVVMSLGIAVGSGQAFEAATTKTFFKWQL